MPDTRTVHAERPLSPHLQIYRWPVNMGLSILHRMTGAALAVGTLMVCWWLVAIASGPDAYAVFQDFSGSALGLLMIFGWSFALFYHMANGVRHLIWDTGALFNNQCASKAGLLVMAVAIAMTACAWFCAYNF